MQANQTEIDKAVKQVIDQAIDAERERREMVQLYFLVYDRGQCKDADDKAVLAIVNGPGVGAHYIYLQSTKQWQFVQLPSMGDENHVATLLGFPTIGRLQAFLEPQLGQYLKSVGMA